jgi:hypothetical protein
MRSYASVIRQRVNRWLRAVIFLTVNTMPHIQLPLPCPLYGEAKVESKRRYSDVDPIGMQIGPREKGMNEGWPDILRR